MIDLVNKIGQEDIYYSIFARDDRNYFPLFPYDDFKQWFSSVFTQAFTAWFDNHFSQELSSFCRLSKLILFMCLVESKLDFLRDDLIEKRKEEIKLINDACSVCLN
ncbi:hypothetical protein [Bartonella vinsonii]|uniref:hypothetical protein n=1 Tax=Bartonella vinsonii TaxID=33047 RepID=UPI001F34FB9A|nr:hypothetical protein [Bartonella vinsonii]